MRLRSTRLSCSGVGAGIPTPAARIDLTTEAAIDALAFSRTSGATRVADDGTFRWARENLCRYSDGTRFSNAVWVKSNLTITDTAYLTTAFGGPVPLPMGRIARNDAVTNAYGGTAALSALVIRRGLIHASIVVKPELVGSGARFGLRIQGAYPSRVDAVFDLDTGTLVGQAASNTYIAHSAWAVALPDGCWELHLRAIGAGSNLSNFYFGPAPTSATVGAWETAGTTVPCYIARPQLNSGTGTQYYEAQANFRFMPRMQRDWQGNVLGLWCEPASTQLITTSELLLSGASGVAITAGADWGDFATSTLTTDNVAVSKFGRATVASVTSGLPYTLSGVLHAPSGAVFAQLVFAGAGFSTSAYITVGLDGGGGAAVTYVGPAIRNVVLTKLGGGRWFVSATSDSTATGSTSVGPLFGIVPAADSGRLQPHTISGLVLNVSCPQFVQAEEWSSYIPTYSATATRAADLAFSYSGDGNEMIVAGGFGAGADSAWIPASTAPATTSIDTLNGYGILTSDGTARARLRQNVAVEVGKQYRIRVESPYAVEVWVGSASGFTDLLQITLGSGVRDGVFTATTTMASITLTTTGMGSALVDSVSLQAAVPYTGFVSGSPLSLVVVGRRNAVPTVSPSNRAFVNLYGLSASDRVSIVTGAAIGTQHRCEVAAGGSVQAQMAVTSTAQADTQYAIGMSVRANDFHANQVPGGFTTSDSSGTVPPLNSVHIGNQNNGSHLNGAVKRILVYGMALTPAQLAKVLAKEASS